MLDLSQEILVPLKTIGKRRDGVLAVFVGSSGLTHRFCPLGHEGSYTVQNSGKKFNGETSGPTDIVSIGKPWKPINGEEVRVIGYGIKEHWEACDQDVDDIEDQAKNLTNYRYTINISDTDINLPESNSQSLIRVRAMSVNYLVARCQLRPYFPLTTDSTP